MWHKYFVPGERSFNTQFPFPEMRVQRQRGYSARPPFALTPRPEPIQWLKASQILPFTPRRLDIIADSAPLRDVVPSADDEHELEANLEHAEVFLSLSLALSPPSLSSSPLPSSLNAGPVSRFVIYTYLYEIYVRGGGGVKGVPGFWPVLEKLTLDYQKQKVGLSWLGLGFWTLGRLLAKQKVCEDTTI